MQGVVLGRRARNRARIVSLCLSLLIISGCLAFSLRGTFAPIDLSWQGFLFRFRHAAQLDPSTGHIAIIAYDAESQQALGGALGRADTAALVRRLHDAGVRVIVLDRLYESVNTPGTDLLSRAMHQAGNVVVAQEVNVEDRAFTDALSLIDLDPAIDTAARAIGIANVPDPDQDGQRRWYDAAVSIDSLGHDRPSLALQAARLLAAQPANDPFLINFAGPSANFPHYSLASILDGRQSMAGLRGWTVLVGDTVAADKDVFQTPVDPMTYGVELHAQALNTLLLNDPLRRAPPIGVLLATVVPALLGTLWALRHRYFASMAVIIGLALCVLGVSVAAFLVFGFWLDIATPLLAIFLAPLSVLGVRLGTEEKANRALRALFGRYVSPNVVARIIDDPDAFGLDGELRDITVLFSDLRGFTALSESLTPREVVNVLRRYLTAMVEEIHAHGGTVDKYVGDSVMALFGAPDPLPNAPAQAVAAALAMHRRLDALNQQFERELGRRLVMGIGLHHGLAAVGVIGAPSKREYSAIGDTVNVAARLEGLTKDLQCSIVATEAIVARVDATLLEVVVLRNLGPMAIRGREGQIHIYSINPAVSPALP